MAMVSDGFSPSGMMLTPAIIKAAMNTGRTMTTYIALFNLTDAEHQGTKDSQHRLDAAKKLLLPTSAAMKRFHRDEKSSTRPHHTDVGP